MKFKVQMKDPDTLQDAIEEAVKAQVKASGIDDPEEQEAVIELRKERTSELCQKCFEYGEYLTVEIDTDAGTATVVER
jgi:hypothetical protein